MPKQKTASLHKLFDNNKAVLILSFITAVIFWVVITVTASPDSENTIAGVSISIPTENSVVKELGLDIIDDITNLTASVNVSGPAYVVSTLGTQDVSVSASVSNVTNAGTYELELKAVKRNSKLSGEFEITSITPAKITLTFDYIDTKQFTVTPQVIGASAVEGLVAEPAVVSDNNNSTLNIKGSRTNIEKISKVVATAEVNKILSETETFDSTLKIYDADDKELDQTDYTITAADGVSAPDIKLSVPISKVKSVPITAQFINPPSEFKNKSISYSLSDEKIDIIGPPETIDATTSIMLSEINFDDISSNNQLFNASIILPDGVKAVDNIDSVKVTVTGLEDYVIRTFTVSKISATGEGGKSVKLTRNIRNVKVFGPRSVLKNITSSDFYAVVDVTGSQSGQHTVKARIICSASGKVWQIGSYNASVEIK